MFNWRNVNFADDESTEVEVLFEPTESGTRVTVQHRGWAALRCARIIRRVMGFRERTSAA